MSRHPSITHMHLLHKPHQMAVTFSACDPLETLTEDVHPENLMRHTQSFAYRFGEFIVTLKFGSHDL